LHQALLKEPDFLSGDYTIKWLENWLAELEAQDAQDAKTVQEAQEA